jgi:hypothetical protein
MKWIKSLLTGDRELKKIEIGFDEDKNQPIFIEITSKEGPKIFIRMDVEDLNLFIFHLNRTREAFNEVENDL